MIETTATERLNNANDQVGREVRTMASALADNFDAVLVVAVREFHDEAIERGKLVTCCGASLAINRSADCDATPAQLKRAIEMAVRDAVLAFRQVDAAAAKGGNRR